MSGQDRRTHARILTDFALVLSNEQGVELDGRALAHDVSDKGFKAETQAELKNGQTVGFRLVLTGGRELRGRAKVIWAHREQFSWWAGARFIDLPWSARRRIRRMTTPETDWGVITDKAILALALILGTLVAWIVFSSPLWRHVLADIFPEIVAAVAMGMALRVLLSRD